MAVADAASCKEALPYHVGVLTLTRITRSLLRSGTAFPTYRQIANQFFSRVFSRT